MSSLISDFNSDIIKLFLKHSAIFRNMTSSGIYTTLCPLSSSSFQTTSSQEPLGQFLPNLQLVHTQNRYSKWYVLWWKCYVNIYDWKFWRCNMEYFGKGDHVVILLILE